MTTSDLVFKGSSSPAASLTPVIGMNYLTVAPTGPGFTVFVFVGNLGTASTGVSGLGATWTRIANVAGTGVGTEIWMGEDPTSLNGNITVAFAASTKPMLHFALMQGNPGSWTVGTPVTATGTGTSADPGSTVTPAVNDLIFFSETHASATGASTSTDTPAGGGINQWAGVGAVAGTAQNNNTAYRGAAANTTATKRVYTIPSSNWAVAMVQLTPVPPSTVAGSELVDEHGVNGPQSALAGFAYRGRDTKVLDAAGSY